MSYKSQLNTYSWVHWGVYVCPGTKINWVEDQRKAKRG